MVLLKISPPCHVTGSGVYRDSWSYIIGFQNKLTADTSYIPFAHSTYNSKIANIKNYNTRPKPTS